MSFAPHFHMPGSYHFDGPNKSSSSLNSGIFRPPISPSGSTYNLVQSTGSLLSDTSMVNTTPGPPRLGRKRTYDESTPVNTYTSFNTMEPASESPMADSTRGHSRYVLAGQIETPGLQTTAENGILEESEYSDVNYRRAMGPKRLHDEFEMPPSRLVNVQLGSEAGITPRSAGWSTFAFQAIGGVVGRVWDFCRTRSFNGFTAGGGKGYGENGQAVPTPKSNDFTPADGVSSPAAYTPSAFSPPGGYPQSDFMPYIADYHDLTSPDVTPERPAAKRRQTGAQYENDELRREWVIVDEDEQSPATRRPTFERRRTSLMSAPSARPPTRPNMTSYIQQPRLSRPPSSLGRRISVPTPRLSAQQSSIPQRPARQSFAGHAGSPALSAHEPASFASPRSPTRTSRPETPSVTTPTCGTTRIPQPKSLRSNPFAQPRTASPDNRSRPSSRQSYIPSPLHSSISKASHRRTTSSASAAPTVRRRPSLDVEDLQASPRLDDEAKVLAAKHLTSEKRTVAKMDTLNARLQAMIRQGQEALGTKYDVAMDESWDEE